MDRRIPKRETAAPAGGLTARYATKPAVPIRPMSVQARPSPRRISGMISVYAKRVKPIVAITVQKPSATTRARWRRSAGARERDDSGTRPD
jgi:hypothetical protein